MRNVEFYLIFNGKRFIYMYNMGKVYLILAWWSGDLVLLVEKGNLICFCLWLVLHSLSLLSFGYLLSIFCNTIYTKHRMSQCESIITYQKTTIKQPSRNHSRLFEWILNKTIFSLPDLLLSLVDHMFNKHLFTVLLLEFSYELWVP